MISAASHGERAFSGGGVGGFWLLISLFGCCEGDISARLPLLALTVRYRKRLQGALQHGALVAEANAASDNGALLSDDAGRAERAPGNFR